MRDPTTVPPITLGAWQGAALSIGDGHAIAKLRAWVKSRIIRTEHTVFAPFYMGQNGVYHRLSCMWTVCQQFSASIISGCDTVLIV